VRENSGINGKQGEKRNVFQFFCVVCVAVAIVLVLTFPGAARAALRHSRIEAVPGFRFENLVYSWNKVMLDVVNTTSSNNSFEGTMIFLDRRGKTVARANLLPRNIAARRSQRYNAYFVEGSGETARRALRVLWDFNSR